MTICFRSASAGTTISYGRNANDLALQDVAPTHAGIRLSVDFMGVDASIELKLAGTFQAHNVLCAAGLAIGCGASPDDVLAALEAWPLITLIAFPEGFINGMLVTTLTVFYPQTMRTFDESYYLDDG